MLIGVTFALVQRVHAGLCASYFRLSLHKSILRKISSNGAIKLDTDQHIFTHPEYSKELFDYKKSGVTTLYEIIKRAANIYGTRPFFSYRNSFDQRFQSYTYRYIIAFTKK